MTSRPAEAANDTVTAALGYARRGWPYPVWRNAASASRLQAGDDGGPRDNETHEDRRKRSRDPRIEGAHDPPGCPGVRTVRRRHPLARTREDLAEASHPEVRGLAMRLCSEAGCASAAVSRGRCRAHAREADRRHHPGEHRKVYSRKRWAMARRRQIVREPMCERCGRLATDVHHRVDLRDGGDPYSLREPGEPLPRVPREGRARAPGGRREGLWMGLNLCYPGVGVARVRPLPRTRRRAKARQGERASSSETSAGLRLRTAGARTPPGEGARAGCAIWKTAG